MTAGPLTTPRLVVVLTYLARGHSVDETALRSSESIATVRAIAARHDDDREQMATALAALRSTRPAPAVRAPLPGVNRMPQPRTPPVTRPAPTSVPAPAKPADTVNALPAQHGDPTHRPPTFAELRRRQRTGHAMRILTEQQLVWARVKAWAEQAGWAAADLTAPNPDVIREYLDEEAPCTTTTPRTPPAPGDAAIPSPGTTTEAAASTPSAPSAAAAGPEPRPAPATGGVITAGRPVVLDVGEEITAPPRPWAAVPCDVCGVIVSAAYIARTGRARHGHHPAGPP